MWGSLCASLCAALLAGSISFADSVAYFASARGAEVLASGEQQGVAVGETFVASGSSILLEQPGGHGCVVLSNGVTLYLTADAGESGLVEVSRFEHKDYAPSTLIWTVEPVRSLLELDFKGGQLLISTPALRDDSDCIVQCGDTTYRLIGGDYILRPSGEANGGYRLDIVSGEARARISKPDGGRFESPYNYLAGESLANQDATIKSTKVNDETLASWQAEVETATRMRRRVYFEKEAAGDSLMGVRLLEKSFLDQDPVNIDYIQSPDKRRP